MLRMASTVTALLLLASLAFAQSLTGLAAIDARGKLMSDLGTALYKDAGRMMKGTDPFNLARAKASFDHIAATAPKLKALFPADSRTGGGSLARPEIWENIDAFAARFDRLATVAAAASAATSDEFSFQDQFARVNDTCNDCHKPFRAVRERK